MPTVTIRPTGDAFDREFNRMRQKLDTVSGPGVINMRDRITIRGSTQQATRVTDEAQTEDQGEFQGDVRLMLTNNSVGWGPVQFIPPRDG